MKPKDNSLLTKMGFRDPDLTTPEHDKMVIFWSKKENILPFLLEIIEDIKRKMGIRSLKLEQLRRAMSIDNSIIYKKQMLKNGVQINVETPITKGRDQYKTIVGYADITMTIDSEDILWDFLIEIKPKIYSFGEVMRQLKTYETFDSRRIVLITKSKGYKELFEREGIWVIEDKKKEVENG